MKWLQGLGRDDADNSVTVVMHSDFAGFDPWNESSKGLADLMEMESRTRAPPSNHFGFHAFGHQPNPFPHASFGYGQQSHPFERQVAPPSYQHINHEAGMVQHGNGIQGGMYVQRRPRNDYEQCVSNVRGGLWPNKAVAILWRSAESFKWKSISQLVSWIIVGYSAPSSDSTKVKDGWHFCSVCQRLSVHYNQQERTCELCCLSWSGWKSMCIVISVLTRITKERPFGHFLVIIRVRMDWLRLPKSPILTWNQFYSLVFGTELNETNQPCFPTTCTLRRRKWVFGSFLLWLDLMMFRSHTFAW